MSDCNNNCEAVAGLNEAAANIVQYRNLINSWLNGAANATVNVAGVNTPTLLKLVTDLRTRINQMPQSILQQNGGIAIDGNGKLYINFATMPDSILYGLLQKIVLEDGGLAFNNQGKMYVDFASMPTDKFDEILETFRKGLSLPKWLKANKNFYVDWDNGSNPATLPEGWGESPDKPFKTIQFALSTVANLFNMATYTATILVASGTYEENIRLPSYSRVTGKIDVQPLPGANVSIKGYFICDGNQNVNFNNIKFFNRSGNSLGTINYFHFYVANGGEITLTDCELHIDTPNGSIQIYPFYCMSNGILRIAGTSNATKGMKIFVGSGIPLQNVFTVNSGTIYQTCHCSISGDPQINGNFAEAGMAGLYQCAPPAGYDPLTWTGNATGRCYYAYLNGIFSVRNAGPNFFPGDINGVNVTGGQYM